MFVTMLCRRLYDRHSFKMSPTSVTNINVTGWNWKQFEYISMGEPSRFGYWSSRSQKEKSFVQNWVLLAFTLYWWRLAWDSCWPHLTKRTRFTEIHIFFLKCTKQRSGNSLIWWKDSRLIRKIKITRKMLGADWLKKLLQNIMAIIVM